MRGALAMAEAARARRPRPAAAARAGAPPRRRSSPELEVLGGRDAAGGGRGARAASRAPARRPGRRARTTPSRPTSPTSPTSAATTRSSRRSRSPRPAATTCFLHGPPGTGKTMLARRLPSHPAAADAARRRSRSPALHSIAGLHDGAAWSTGRPFRAPHHTISASGPRRRRHAAARRARRRSPTTASSSSTSSRSSPRPALEALRQPLEDGRVTIVRGQRVMVFPTRVMLVAASNPCPCGMRGGARCRCSAADLARHQRRLSGPLLDRIDVSVTVGRPSAAALRSQAGAARPPSCASGSSPRASARPRGSPAPASTCNAQMTPRAAPRARGATPDALARALRAAYDRDRLSRPRPRPRPARRPHARRPRGQRRASRAEHVHQAAALRLDDQVALGARA